MVHRLSFSPTSNPIITTSPVKIPIKLMTTCSFVNAERLENITVPPALSQSQCLSRCCLLTFEKHQQVGIDHVCIRSWHSVRETFVGFQYRALHQPRAQWRGVSIRNDLVIIAMHYQSRH